MKNETNHSGFWDGETCEYCGGKLVEKYVTLHRKTNGKYVVIEQVPAGVCTECGTRYYAANVLKTIEASIHGRRQAEREIVVPVYSLEPQPHAAHVA
jgi:YgiT-type zinc finger domain-containing protein